jgi:hypothetical protein
MSKRARQIFTDELKSYDGLETDYQHAVINHAVGYVNGNVHTNTMENFWSLLKRGLHGTYISVEPFHLFRYLDEQAFRYNNRKMTDVERFDIGVPRSSVSVLRTKNSPANWREPLPTKRQGRGKRKP